MISMFFYLFACTNKEDTATSSENTETQEVSSENTNNNSPSSENEDPQNPVVMEADFFCKIEGSGVENWIFQATVEDPQGNNTLESFQPEAGAFLNSSGNQQDFIAIVCNPEGLCTAASTAENLGVGCSQADQYKIRFSISDEDGNQSETQTITARFEGETTDTGQ